MGAEALCLINVAHDNGRQERKLLTAWINNAEEVCDIWLERPQWRVFLDFIEQFPEYVEGEEAEEGRDGESELGSVA
jgi:hypothetical protein